MIKCGVCGYENKEGAQFCLNCGSPIEQDRSSEDLDVSEEPTLLLDPGAMQQRLQEEIRRQRAASGESSAPAAAAAAGLSPPSRQATPTPPSASPSPARPAATQPEQAPAAGSVGFPPRQWITTLILAILLGAFGVHRFYTGRWKTAIGMLVTVGGCGIWYLIDIVLIATNAYKDSEGRDLVR